MGTSSGDGQPTAHGPPPEPACRSTPMGALSYCPGGPVSARMWRNVRPVQRQRSQRQLATTGQPGRGVSRGAAAAKECMPHPFDQFAAFVHHTQPFAQGSSIETIAHGDPGRMRPELGFGALPDPVNVHGLARAPFIGMEEESAPPATKNHRHAAGDGARALPRHRSQRPRSATRTSGASALTPAHQAAIPAAPARSPSAAAPRPARLPSASARGGRG
jgi:hypothetical protein